MMENIVEIKNVSFKYKGAEDGLLNGVSLSIKKGETVLLTGASGSGKTTIIRLINGLIPHYYQGNLEGDVSVDGRDIRNTELYDLAGTVGTVFQNPRSQFFSVDTDGEIAFGPENIGLPPKEIKKRTKAITGEMKLEPLLGRSLFELSGGEKQKIACASVSALMPEVILLDEPSSNLDWDAMEDIRESIVRWKNEGKTVIISEHRLWYLKDLVDPIIYMDMGRIKHEWSREEFAAFDESEVKRLKLRPVKLEEDFIENFRKGKLGGHSVTDRKKRNDDIVLRDFYFSYDHKPYFFFKHKFSRNDEGLLSLNIPELSLPKGKVIAVTGRNGAGKSTFLRCICGLEKDCTGVIEEDRQIFKGKKRLKVCYMVMQDVNHQLFTDSVESEVLLSMKTEDKKRCEEILSELGILEYKDKHPMALSGGQKQRVAIASAIGAEAKLLLFDEPTSGLDFAHMEKVGQLLKNLAKSGKTVLVSTHDPELIDKCCDYVLCIDRGRIKANE